MVARDDNNWRIGKCRTHPAELIEGIENRDVRRADGVKYVPSNDDQVGCCRDDTVKGTSKRPSHIGFTLIDPVGRLAPVLSKSEVQIGEVGELHELRPDLVSNRHVPFGACVNDPGR